MESPEVSTQMLVLGGLTLMLLGVVIGWWLGRNTSASGQKYREVERKLDQVLQDKKLYEDEVVEHFTATAHLLNNLTESYREVHNHLASGAANLCQGQGPVSLDRPGGQRDPAEIPPELAHIQPPLDYAPKSSPDEKGMLNEEFGLERSTTPPQETTQDTPEKA
ncbi:MAG: DUF1043 family protein [Pseudomonadota bacterium]